MNRNIKSFMLAVLSAMIVLIAGCSQNKTTYSTIEELQDKRIAYTVIALQEKVVNEKFPNATKIAFNGQMDTIAAVQAGQADAAMVSYPTAFLVSIK